MLVLKKIYERGEKLIDYLNWFGKVWEIILKYHPRFLEKGLKLMAKTAQDSITYGTQSTASGLVDASWVIGVGRYLSWVAKINIPSL